MALEECCPATRILRGLRLPGLCRAMPASSTVHVLQLLRELLAFVLLSYTVLIGALLLAGWTTYFLVLK